MSVSFVGSAEWWLSRGDVGDVVVCTADEDKCRQEYGVSSDIKYQIEQYGVGHPTRGGSVDYDHMDLTTALALLEESSQAWLRLPKVVRDRYQSWRAVEMAAASGELDQLLKAAGAGASAPASGASASDSAPVPPPAGG